MQDQLTGADIRQSVVLSVSPTIVLVFFPLLLQLPVPRFRSGRKVRREEAGGQTGYPPHLR